MCVVNVGTPFHGSHLFVLKHYQFKYFESSNNSFLKLYSDIICITSDKSQNSYEYSGSKFIKINTLIAQKSLDLST